MHPVHVPDRRPSVAHLSVNPIDRLPNHTTITIPPSPASFSRRILQTIHLCTLTTDSSDGSCTPIPQVHLGSKNLETRKLDSDSPGQIETERRWK